MTRGCGWLLWLASLTTPQELIVKTPGWHFPLVMTMLEFGACCLMPLLLEQPLAQPAASRPLRSYAALTACVMSSAAMANLSLQYVNYPVKVRRCARPTARDDCSK